MCTVGSSSALFNLQVGIRCTSLVLPMIQYLPTDVKQVGCEQQVLVRNPVIVVRNSENIMQHATML